MGRKQISVKKVAENPKGLLVISLYRKQIKTGSRGSILKKVKKWYRDAGKNKTFCQRRATSREGMKE